MTARLIASLERQMSIDNTGNDVTTNLRRDILVNWTTSLLPHISLLRNLFECSAQVSFQQTGTR